jgi:hypothetical protein
MTVRLAFSNKRGFMFTQLSRAAVIIITVVLSSFGHANNLAEPEGMAIDLMNIPPELAYKLAVFGSYFEDPDDPNADPKYATTDRKLVDIRVINPFHKVWTMYLVTLYRGEGEPVSKETLDRAINAWADGFVPFVEPGDKGDEYVSTGELTAERKRAIWDRLSDDIGGSDDYWYCIVARSSPNSLFYSVGAGLSGHMLQPEVGRRILSDYLNAVVDEIDFEGIDLAGYAVYDVSGTKYVVDTAVTPLDALGASIKIVDFESYQRRVESSDDFSPIELSSFDIETANRYYGAAAEIPIDEDWTAHASDVVSLVEEFGVPVIGSSDVGK